MNYHVVLTRRCNLNCQYCHGGEDTGSHTEITYTLDTLAEFLSKDDDPQIMFYGGEPTLKIDLMLEIMDMFPDARFMLQTNGLLIHKIPEKYVKQFNSILVSIDGNQEVTDYYRSKGVYDKVLENVRWLREVNYTGDIVARMAVSEESDIYRDVRHLLDIPSPHFDHVHWQLNVIWDAEGNWNDFDSWVMNSYFPGIRRLVSDWVDKMAEGVIEGIVPFIPVMYTLLTGESSRLRCGSGLDTFAIHVDGSIGVCPISPDWEFSIVGNIKETHPDDLVDIMEVENPCPSCDEFGVCGGRCLFVNKQRLWGESGFQKVCSTATYMIACLRSELPRVRKFVDDDIIKELSLNYPTYNNGCEIIP